MPSSRRWAMRWLAGIIGFLALLVVLLPDLGCSGPKRSVADAKEDDKKDPRKKDADKVEPKRKPKRNLEGRLWPDLHGQTETHGRQFRPGFHHRGFPGGSGQGQCAQYLASERNEPNQPYPSQSAATARAQQMAKYQVQLARKNNEVSSPKDMDLRAADNCKIRSQFPPTEFDDKGRPKVWKQKELSALKGNSKLRGYPADFDRLNVGQTVTAYLAKPAKAPAKRRRRLKKQQPARIRPRDQAGSCDDRRGTGSAAQEVSRPHAPREENITRSVMTTINNSRLLDLPCPFPVSPLRRPPH